MLARIALSDHDVRQLEQELTRLLDYMDQLRRVATDGVEPTTHVLPLKNVLREDVIQPGLRSDVVATLAPHRQGAFVKVPKVLE